MNTFYKKFNRHIEYGTAGFRTKADMLESVFFILFIISFISCYFKYLVLIHYNSEHKLDLL